MDCFSYIGFGAIQNKKASQLKPISDAVELAGFAILSLEEEKKKKIPAEPLIIRPSCRPQRRRETGRSPGAKLPSSSRQGTGSRAVHRDEILYTLRCGWSGGRGQDI